MNGVRHDDGYDISHQSTEQRGGDHLKVVALGTTVHLEMIGRFSEEHGPMNKGSHCLLPTAMD